MLRQALPGVSVVSWIPDVDHRTFPLVAVTRAGGVRHPDRPRLLSHPEVDLSVFHAEGLVQAEELYEDVLDALYDAVRDQTVVAGYAGSGADGSEQPSQAAYLHSLAESQGATLTESPFSDTWCVAGSVTVGLRPV
ncbi:hypothetical protein [Mycolicibacterium gilvum]|uniref:hypothetical protein n=1 Tax=Mycolicibacterium gilvum TaxID=1804 RepID=UPI0040465D8D